jgi:uncharacterized protein YicC (UPF0701 family)
MKPLIGWIACAIAALALLGCGSSSDTGTSATPTPSPTATQASSSAQDQASTQVCSARGDIQAQVKTLTSLSAGNATRADVTSALTAIQSDLQKIKDAQPNLAPERKQQVKDAAAAFAAQLKDVVKQTVSGLTKNDAQTQAKNAAASLESAVKQSLEPIDC